MPDCELKHLYSIIGLLFQKFMYQAIFFLVSFLRFLILHKNINIWSYLANRYCKQTQVKKGTGSDMTRQFRCSRRFVCLNITRTKEKEGFALEIHGQKKQLIHTSFVFMCFHASPRFIKKELICMIIKRSQLDRPNLTWQPAISFGQHAKIHTQIFSEDVNLITSTMRKNMTAKNSASINRKIAAVEIIIALPSWL